MRRDPGELDVQRIDALRVGGRGSSRDIVGGMSNSDYNLSV